MARAHLLVSGTCFAAFLALAVLAHSHAYFAWDVPVAHAIQKVPRLWPLMKAVSVPGYGWRAVILVLLTALLLAWSADRSAAGSLIVSTAMGEALDKAAKLLVARPRPGASVVTIRVALRDPSFPSGHVVFYCAYFGFVFALAYLHRARWPRLSALVMPLSVMAVFLVGISRVYLGAHWPSDVLGGYLLGLGWLSLVVLAYRRTLPATAGR